jgi:hypothetical protein
MLVVPTQPAIELLSLLDRFSLQRRVDDAIGVSHVQLERPMLVTAMRSHPPAHLDDPVPVLALDGRDRIRRFPDLILPELGPRAPLPCSFHSRSHLTPDCHFLADSGIVQTPPDR